MIMNLRTLLLTRNNCHITGIKMTPAGIMVHSTGANNPYLKRYVGPDDGLLGANTNNNHWNQPKPDGREVCAHAFIGKLNNDTIATYQTLPWDMRGWHSGGNANNTYIGFEICEDSMTDPVYFEKVYREAAELCAMLCRIYGIKPEKPALICHSEGSAIGIASAHSDVMHWFPKHGKSMDIFRADVRKVMGEAEKADSPPLSAVVYRVRKTWEDVVSQVGAYKELGNAVAAADERKVEGYRVFGEDGAVVYTPVAADEKIARLYIDISGYNRPFDSSAQLKSRREADAELLIQSAALAKKYSLSWSYMLDYENENNPSDEKRKVVALWKEIADVYCPSSEAILSFGREIMKRGVNAKDALHIACAIKSGCEYFITTDKKLAGKKAIGLNIVNPIDFVKDIVKPDTFDYTRWRRNLWEGKNIEDIHMSATQHERRA